MTFLEKVVELLLQIGQALPAYEQYAKLLRSLGPQSGRAYPRVAKALSNVYLLLLRFCHRVCLLYSRKRMGTLRPHCQTKVLLFLCG